MSNAGPECCVCLNPHETSENLGSINEKFNERILVQLQKIVPEVDWQETYNICPPCLIQLNIVTEFRQSCLILDSQRKFLLTPGISETGGKPLVIFYTCFHCQRSFNDKLILERHIQKEHFNKKFPCPDCGKLYTSQKIVKTHMKKCGKNVENIQNTRKTARKQFSCEVCDVTLHFAKAIVEHCVSEHGLDGKSVKPYTCDECPMRFTTSTNLIQHKKYHKGNRNNICSFCGKSFITKNDLTVHEYTHFNRRNYKCEFCGKAFNTNKNLRTHIFVVHTDSSLWKYYCQVCNRNFPLKSGYEQHMRRHNGDKRFNCTVCNKPFISRSELKKHMNFHSKVKPFQCEHCDKSYKCKSVYVTHLNKIHGHLGEKPID